MSITVNYNGVKHTFPDDATEDEIRKALDQVDIESGQISGLKSAEDRIKAGKLAVERANKGVLAAAALPPSIEKNIVERVYEKAEPVLEPLAAPVTGLGMLADVLQTGGRNIAIPAQGKEQGGVTGFLTGGARLDESLAAQAVDTLRRRVALSTAPFVPDPNKSTLENMRAAAGHAIGAATGIGTGGLGLGTGEVPGEEQHVRESFEKTHKPLAVAEATAEPVAEMASSMVLDPAMAGMGALGSLASEGRAAQALLRSSTALTPEAAQAAILAANAGRVASIGAGTLGATFLPGMAAGGGAGIGGGLASLDQGQDVKAARQISQGTVDLAFAGLAAKHLKDSLTPEPKPPAQAAPEGQEPPKNMLEVMQEQAKKKLERMPQSDPEPETNKPVGTRGRGAGDAKLGPFTITEKGTIKIGPVPVPVGEVAGIAAMSGVASHIGLPASGAIALGTRWALRRAAANAGRSLQRAAVESARGQSKPAATIGTPDPATIPESDTLRSTPPTLEVVPEATTAPVTRAGGASYPQVTMPVPPDMLAAGEAAPATAPSETLTAMVRAQFPRNPGEKLADYEARILGQAARIEQLQREDAANPEVRARALAARGRETTPPTPEEIAARRAQEQALIAQREAAQQAEIEAARAAIVARQGAAPAPTEPAPPPAAAKVETPAVEPVKQAKSQGTVEDQFARIEKKERAPSGVEQRFAKETKGAPLTLDEMRRAAEETLARAEGKTPESHPKNPEGVTTKDLETHPAYTQVMTDYATGKLQDMHGNKILPMEENDRRARAIAFRMAGKAIEQARNVKAQEGLGETLKASVEAPKKRVDVKKILANPEQKREMMTRTIQATQAREGVETTREQAEAAYDKVQAEKVAQKAQPEAKAAPQEAPEVKEAPKAPEVKPKAPEAKPQAQSIKRTPEHRAELRGLLDAGEYEKAAKLARDTSVTPADRVSDQGHKVGYVDRNGNMVVDILEDGTESRLKATPKGTNESSFRPGAGKQYALQGRGEPIETGEWKGEHWKVKDGTERYRMELPDGKSFTGSIKGDTLTLGRIEAKGRGAEIADRLRDIAQKLGLKRIVMDSTNKLSLKTKPAGSVSKDALTWQDNLVKHGEGRRLDDGTFEIFMDKKGGEAARFPGEEGTEAVVTPTAKGFSVSLRDTEAGETLPGVKIFTDRTAATEYAKKLASGKYSIEGDYGELKKTPAYRKPLPAGETRLPESTRTVGRMVSDVREAGVEGKAKEQAAQQVKAELPAELKKNAYVDDDTRHVIIDTPRGTIRIIPKDKIEFDMEAVEKGWGKKARVAAEAGKASAAGVKYTLKGEAIVEIADTGKLGHEVQGHVFIDHFATGKERNALWKKFGAEAERQNRSVEEVVSDVILDAHKRLQKNHGWQPKNMVGRWAKRVVNFFQAARQKYFPTAESTVKYAAEGKWAGRKGAAISEVEPGHIVTPEQAKGINMKTTLPDTDEFRQMVANTPGARVDEDGLHINLVRFQKPEQTGAESVRTGVFYLPEGSPKGRHYKTNLKTGTGSAYGGEQKITGETVLRNPLVVKGATGGAAPERAYRELRGNQTFDRFQDEVSDAAYGRIEESRELQELHNKRRALEAEGKIAESNALAAQEYRLRANSEQDARVERIAKLLTRYGYDLYDGSAKNAAWNIVLNSGRANQLRYAIQEHVIAQVVRDAGYDSIVGFTKGKNGLRIDEIFDVREKDYPIQNEPATLHEKFNYSIGPKGTGSALGRQLATAEGLRKGKKIGKGVIYEKQKFTAPRLASKASERKYSLEKKEEPVVLSSNEAIKAKQQEWLNRPALKPFSVAKKSALPPPSALVAGGGARSKGFHGTGLDYRKRK